MAIVAADLELWCSVNNPEDDSAQSGGAIQDDAHASGGIKPVFTDIAATDNIEAVSDGTDTRNITIKGRLASGVIASETIALTGTTPITTSNQYAQFISAVLASKDGSRTVTVRRATGDTEIAVLGPNVVQARRLFVDASVPGSGTTDRYELVYFKNKHGTLSLLSAVVKLTGDPASKLTVALAAATGDVSAITNRVTVPGSLEGSGFVDDNVGINVPGTNLAAGARIACWLKQSLAAGAGAFDNTWTLQLAGNTAA